jgi:hypothetical protein
VGLHAHPFLSELACGVLPLEKFRLFIEQDILYLPGGRREEAVPCPRARVATGTLTSGDPHCYDSGI